MKTSEDAAHEWLQANGLPLKYVRYLGNMLFLRDTEHAAELREAVELLRDEMRFEKQPCDCGECWPCRANAFLARHKGGPT